MASINITSEVVPEPNSGKKLPKGRLSEPRNWIPTSAGGVGLVARRNTNYASSLVNANTTQNLAIKSPMRLLQELPAIHPTVGLAQWNALRSMFPTGSWGFKAYKPAGPNDPDALVGEQDRAMETEIANFVSRWPREIRGLTGLAETTVVSLLYTGMACMEGVPSKNPLEGLLKIVPVDSLTIAFGREDRNSDLHPYQMQQFPRSGPGKQPSGWFSNWVPMNIETFFWSAIDQQVDDPFGLPPYGTAVNEVLADLALIRDLRDAVHNAAWPRLDVGVNLAELHKVAVEVHRITDPKKASAWVQDQFDKTVAYVESLAPDENVVHDTSGKVETKQPGSFQGLEGVLNFLRQRLVQALKSLPTLMGINDGGTYNYTSIEWAIYAAGLEALRDIVLELIAAALNLHIRLKGSTSIVKPWADKIRTNDALVEANTMEVEIRNSVLQETLGYITHDEASERITKRPAVKTADEEMLKTMAGAASQPNKDQSGSKGNAGQGGANKGNNEGSSQEEKKTAGKK